MPIFYDRFEDFSRYLYKSLKDSATSLAIKTVLERVSEKRVTDEGKTLYQLFDRAPERRALDQMVYEYLLATAIKA